MSASRTARIRGQCGRIAACHQARTASASIGSERSGSAASRRPNEAGAHRSAGGVSSASTRSAGVASTTASSSSISPREHPGGGVRKSGRQLPAPISERSGAVRPASSGSRESGRTSRSQGRCTRCRPGSASAHRLAMVSQSGETANLIRATSLTSNRTSLIGLPLGLGVFAHAKTLVGAIASCWSGAP